jgi:nuclear pore complex protein Nup160
MCERNKVELMMSFNFVGLTGEVEEALGHHARTADPLLRPSYSQILYSWYIRRGDYREGTLISGPCLYYTL